MHELDDLHKAVDEAAGQGSRAQPPHRAQVLRVALRRRLCGDEITGRNIRRLAANRHLPVEMSLELRHGGRLTNPRLASDDRRRDWTCDHRRQYLEATTTISATHTILPSTLAL